MSIGIRRATPDDARTLAEHRAAVWREVGDWSDTHLAPQIPIWTAYFRDAVAEGSYVAWIAEEDGAAVASGAVLVHRALPRPGFPSDQEGRVLSVYVTPGARRRGIARAMMEQAIAYARAAQLIRLTLRPSDEARPLYTALGFEAVDELALRLQP